MHDNDTIAAIATAPGMGGIGIIRISGENSKEIAVKIFRNKNGEPVKVLKDRFFHYGKILDEDNEVIDEVLLVPMESPRSYTKEGIVEIHCHGGIIPITKILKRVLSCGARLAEPGEFTKRAFLNGRIDLVQAEGIMDLICARSEEAARVSIRQMEGRLSEEIRKLSSLIMDIFARIEVTIDYPEEDIDDVVYEDIKEKINIIMEKTKGLLDTVERGKLVSQGVKTVIIGKPNVGKSTLLNALVRENRAIVTDIPGTTRDIIEEDISIKGILVRVVDTAGIRETIDVIEKIGVKRSRENISDADLLIVVMDASKSFEKDDETVLKWIEDKKALIVLNKIDKPTCMNVESVKSLIKGKPIIETSLINNVGVEDIENAIYDMVFSGRVQGKDEVLITRIRHKEALLKAYEALGEALKGLDAKLPVDLITIDLRNALESLGSITGETIDEKLIDKIFKDFCLGK